MNKDKFAKVAIEAARQAGKIHKKYFTKNIEIRTKSTSFDRVTIADIESEKKIVSLIRDYFLGHNFLAEENKYKRTDSEYTWIIDPLDGTNNFSHGLPIFCVSIALAKRDRIVLGVVYDVVHDELFFAQRNRGAYLNGKKISVTDADKLEEALLITGFYYDRGRQMIENLENIKRFFLKNIVGLRRFGSAALDLCYIACGRASGFWEFILSPWDFAAGKLIVEEAGGKVTGRDGQGVNIEKSFIVASNGKIHKQMLEVLK
ncbi:MAG: inositol monophosphatase [Candidatus Omnitrophica bacterium]|nr:inositol monophosphatase [Candidatus Omnitrophota bacterium]